MAWSRTALSSRSSNTLFLTTQRGKAETERHEAFGASSIRRPDGNHCIFRGGTVTMRGMAKQTARRIDSDAQSIGELLRKPLSYSVPPNQRDFSWTRSEEHTSELLSLRHL